MSLITLLLVLTVSFTKISPAMGCASSSLWNQTDDFSQLSFASSLSHHLGNLTSSTYALLNPDHMSPPPPSAAMTPPEEAMLMEPVSGLDATPMTPPEPLYISTEEPVPVEPEEPIPVEVIDVRELMSDLDDPDSLDAPDSFRYSPVPCNVPGGVNQENWDPNLNNPRTPSPLRIAQDPIFPEESENLSPPDGKENRVVIYTTSLRGIRRTFDACSAVKAAIESYGVVVCERDLAVDRGFRDDLTMDMAKNNNPQEADATAGAILPPRVFVKGRYIGGAEEVLTMVEEGQLANVLRGVPRKRGRGGCDCCGGFSFLMCSGCNGSCKNVVGFGTESFSVQCIYCNENGLLRCPLCT